MTIKQCIKEKGWIMEVTEIKRFQSVDVAFINNEEQYCSCRDSDAVC